MTEKKGKISDIIKKHINDIDDLMLQLNATNENSLVTKLKNNLDASKGLIEQLYFIANSTRKLAVVGNKFVLQQKKGRSKKKIDETKLKSLVEVGITNLQIAKIFKVSEATIRRRLKELGIKRKSSRSNLEGESKEPVKAESKEPIKAENTVSHTTIQKSDAGFGQNK